MEQASFRGSQETTGKVALLIDGDNLPASFAEQMLVRAGRFGQVIVKRVYLDPHHLKNWEEASGFGLQVARSGRDAADLLLAIDAVDLAHRGDLGTFVIASSDGGFAPLARFLVERGHTVLGLGGATAPADWRRSCTRFEELVPRAAMPSNPGTAGPQPRTSIPPPAKDAQILMRAAGAEATESEPSCPPPAGSGGTILVDSRIMEVLGGQGAAGVPLSLLGTKLKEHGLDKDCLEERSWLKYLKARPHLFLVSREHPNVVVRMAASVGQEPEPRSVPAADELAAAAVGVWLSWREPKLKPAGA